MTAGAGRRLFFALWPDDAVRHALAHWQTHSLPATVRWQHRADLHMTLNFLGHVDNSLIGRLETIGSSRVPAPFTLVIDRIGHWAGSQVIWAGPTSPPGDLLALQSGLARDLSDAGLRVETQPFQPHLTLALGAPSAIEVGPLEPFTWSVTQLALVESVTGPAPRFHPRLTWNLG